MKILLVDDEPLSRKAVFQFLEQDLGHDVTDCSDGTDAQKILQKETFSLVVSDIRMPKLNGLELLRWIKRNFFNTDVILITGHGDLDTAVKALRYGAYDFIRKPIDVEELAASVSRSMERQALINENLELKQKRNISNIETLIKRAELPKNQLDLKKFESIIIKKALAMNDNNKIKTANYLGISISSLYRKLASSSKQ